MKLSTLPFAVSIAVAFVLVWTLCSVLVLLFPTGMLTMTEHMVHADLADFDWTLTWTGYLVGLVMWAVWAGLTGWVAAAIYNRMMTQFPGVPINSERGAERNA